MRNLKRILILTAMAAGFTACLNMPGIDGGYGAGNAVETVAYYRTGGLEGHESLSVTKDSIHYALLAYLGESIAIEKRMKTPDGVWEKLIASCDTAAFAQIQSGRTTAEVDGVDYYFSITASGREISFVNALVDENYQKLQTFFDVLLTEIRGSLLEEHFCSLVNSDKMHFAKPALDLFFASLSHSVDPLYETLTDEQKLRLFTAWLKTHDCITDAQIFCVSCVYTLPAQSEIYFTFLSNGQAVTRCMDILMSEPLRFVRVHDVY
jgi:hypothetical protein